MKKLHLLLLSTLLISPVKSYAEPDPSAGAGASPAPAAVASSSQVHATEEVFKEWKNKEKDYNKFYKEDKSAARKAYLNKLATSITGNEAKKEAAYKQASEKAANTKAWRDYYHDGKVVQEVDLARQKNKTASIGTEIEYRKIDAKYNNAKPVGVMQEVKEAAGRAQGFSKATEGAKGLAIGVGSAVGRGYESASNKLSALKSKVPGFRKKADASATSTPTDSSTTATPAKKPGFFSSMKDRFSRKKTTADSASSASSATTSEEKKKRSFVDRILGRNKTPKDSAAATSAK